MIGDVELCAPIVGTPSIEQKVTVYELTDDQWKRVFQFIRGIIVKMSSSLPWNERSPITFEDWVQLGCVAIVKMHKRDKCPEFNTPDYWKLAATYVRTEIRNEVQKLTTKGRNINATENDICPDSCTFANSSSCLEPDRILIENQTISVLEMTAKRLSDKHHHLLQLLIGGHSRSDFYALCKELHVEPKTLNSMWKQLHSACYDVLEISIPKPRVKISKRKKETIDERHKQDVHGDVGPDNES